jgi:EAL domain-containing protein (putative c-di-GMP-specific phosphodiesterase class I)
VSRAQLTSPTFLPALHGALICANVDPALIELELTESLVMDESEIVQQNLRRARETGVGWPSTTSGQATRACRA